MTIIRNNSSDDNKQETERANANNANNIRNAAEVAIASGEPHAAAVGVAVKALDGVTGGKSTDAFGRLATRATRVAPGGKKIQDASNKLSESGASDAIGKAASIKNGMNSKAGKGPTTNKKTDVGEKKLKDSKANRGNHLWNNKKKKKNEEAKKNEDTSTEDTSNNSDTNDDSSESISETLKKIRRIRLIIRLTAIGVAIFMIIVIFLSIFMAITGINLVKTLPIVGPSTYETEEFQPVYEEGTTEYENEIKYYKKLEEVKKEYDKSHGDELKTSYIHAVLILKYYQVETNDKDSNGKDIPIDFSKLTSMVDKIYALMKSQKEENRIDYEKKGEYYNNLKNSDDFKKYYEELLKQKNIDDLLDEIFDLAKELDELQNEDNTVITEETEVNIPTSGKKLTINEYLSNSIYAEASSLSNSELVKAYTIAYSTNIVAKNKNLTIDSNAASMSNELCSTSEGCSYDKNGNLVSGPGEQSDKNNVYYNGSYYYRKPLSNSEIASLNKTINNVFGNVLVKDDGTYPTLDMNKIVGLGDGDYKSILANSFGNYSIKNVGENSYILDASYGDKKVLVNVNFYDQGDYSEYSFCGLKKETIATSGCGVTSMAMVVSTYENNSKYTPVWANDIARKNGQCGAGRGTDYSHFKYVSKEMGYKTPIIYEKNKASGWRLAKSSYNNILRHLANGDLVIVNVSKGHFTSGGHYMVLGGIDPDTKKVYVYDPNNKSNSKYRKTGNGWWSFNDIIAPESKAFIILEKKG